MSQVSRFAFIDLLRILASQMIVLHHLAFYGPLSDHAYPVAGGAIDWLYQYGRLTVQIFFVTGGYCLAGSLARRPPMRLRAFVPTVVERYFRIGLPYLVALAVALVANAVARSLMDHPSISASPTPWQLLAHVFLLHNVLGYESLTAGIWYVAIDLQLGVFVYFIHAVGYRVSPSRGYAIARWTLLAMGLVSAFFWNRIPSLDRFGSYFLASYVLGMVAGWTREGSVSKGFFWGYLGAIAFALHVDFRSRLALAGVIAALLVLARGQVWLDKFCSTRPVQRLGVVTYSLFLIHFPICLLINAWWSSGLPPDPWRALLGMALAWGLSIVGAFLFYHLVETHLARLRLPDERAWKGLASSSGNPILRFLQRLGILSLLTAPSKGVHKTRGEGHVEG
jgi:peptidoglycan/LPS O-acetylase OafA/YrhL